MEEKKELNIEELKNVVGGVGENGYKYSFRSNDWVKFSREDDVLLVSENVDTNDDDRMIQTIREVGHGLHVFDGNYYMISAKRLYRAYKDNGGSLHAMS